MLTLSVIIKEKVINLYAKTSWKRWFVKIRFWDAPLVEISKLVPEKTKVLDLGCGEGTLSNYLALEDPKRKIIGVEIDSARVNDARRGLPNVEFKKGDVTKIKIPECDVILMTHLLHHLPSKDAQTELLTKIANGLNKNQKLIITEVAEKPFIKYLISWLTDAFVVPILFEKSFYNFNFFYRKQSEWEKLFADLKLKVKIIKADDDKPFSHIIFECRKK